MKPGFTPLVTEYIDGRNWLLVLPLTYTAKDGTKYVTPSGFVTDFASIPRLLWRILPPAGDGPRSDYAPAAVIHDFHYRRTGVSKATADRLFLEGLEVLGVPRFTRTAMYWAVRLFGRGGWTEKAGV